MDQGLQHKAVAQSDIEAWYAETAKLECEEKVSLSNCSA